MSYFDDVPMGQGLDSISGFRVKVDAAPHKTNFLQFGNPSVFRIIPEIRDGRELPWRLSTGLGDFSGWVKGVRMVAKLGVLDKFTCIATPKGRPSREEGPIDFFHKGIYEAVENDPRSFPEEWQDWMTYKKGMGSRLFNPEYYALLQGALYEHNGKQFINKMTKQYDPLFPAILALKTSARMSLENLCNNESPSWSGKADDYDTRYMIGDVFSLAKGSAIRIIPVPDDGRVRAHYEIENMKHPIPLDLELVSAAYWPWDKLLAYLTEQEMVKNLERCFPASAVDFALSKSPYGNLLSTHVRGEFSRMMSKVSIQGMGPGVQIAHPQNVQVSPPGWQGMQGFNPAAVYPGNSPVVDLPKPPVVGEIPFAPPGQVNPASAAPSFNPPSYSPPPPQASPALTSPGAFSSPAPVAVESKPEFKVPATTKPEPFQPPAAAPLGQPVMGSPSGGDTRNSVAERLRAMKNKIDKPQG